MFKDPYLDFAFRWRCSGALFGSRIHVLAVKTLFHQHFAVPVQSQFCLGVFSETAHIYRITRTKYLLIEVWIHLSVLISISLKLPNFLFLARTCGSGSRLEKSNLWTPDRQRSCFLTHGPGGKQWSEGDWSFWRAFYAVPRFLLEGMIKHLHAWMAVECVIWVLISTTWALTCFAQLSVLLALVGKP